MDRRDSRDADWVVQMNDRAESCAKIGPRVMAIVGAHIQKERI